MLDQDLIEQLKSAFASLENEIVLEVDESNHENQAELDALLSGVASASPKIQVRKSNKSASVPSFRLRSGAASNGQAKISFRGIPGGHEFTSLVLAILNFDGKGKLPDAGIANRIRKLKGPIRLSTYVSLTCENCPDVVQALNQMAILHGDFSHEMVDGGYVPEEVEKLGIQGVPSLVHEGKMIHSGRIHFLDLLAKLEQHFGASENASATEEARDLGQFDVAVVGGGPAGVSAAIYSARKGFRTVLLAERMGGQVQDTKGIENMISIPYTEGPQLADAMVKHLAEYPVKILEQRRVKNISKEKKIELEGGESLTAKAIIITSGAKWRELGVPGEKEYIGRGVAYCPHCDGPFYKGKKIAVIGGGNSGVEAAIDLAGIAGEVVLFEYNDALKADKVLVDKLQSLPNTKIVLKAKTQELIGDGKKVVAIEYFDRSTEKKERMDIDGVFIQIGLLPNSSFVKDTVELTKFGEIKIDEKGRTNVKGIYAAGDVTTTPYKQIVIAMGEGAKVALAVFEDQMYS